MRRSLNARLKELGFVFWILWNNWRFLYGSVAWLNLGFRELIWSENRLMPDDSIWKHQLRQGPEDLCRDLEKVWGQTHSSGSFCRTGQQIGYGGVCGGGRAM